jgi:hypothetical protein
VDLALDLGRHLRELRGGRELSEIQHPVDLPMAVVHVDRILEQDRQLDERGRVVVDRVQTGEVRFDLGAQAVAPPVGEVRGVVRQDPVEITADAVRIAGTSRHPRRIPGVVLGRLGLHLRAARDRRGVHVAVDALGDPVAGKRRAEAAEHVVTRQPPTADVEEHRRHGVRHVQVVEDPEQVALTLVPLDRKLVASEEPAQHAVAHAVSLLVLTARASRALASANNK